MSEVFDELRRIIVRSGMTPDTIAWRAGCHRVTVRAWLAGRVTEPHLPTLLKVAKVFGKTIELTDGEARIVPDTPASVAAKLNRAREFVGYWRRYQ